MLLTLDKAPVSSQVDDIRREIELALRRYPARAHHLVGD